MCTLLDSQHDFTVFPWIHQRYIARRIYRMKHLDVFLYGYRIQYSVIQNNFHVELGEILCQHSNYYCP